MNFFSSLFQSKSHLPPFFRCLAVYLETQIVAIVLAGFAAGSQYLLGHQQIDAQGLLQFVYAGVMIAVGKGLTGLVPQIQAALAAQMNAKPAAPPVIVHNNLPAPVQPAQAAAAPVIPARPQFAPQQFTAPQQAIPAQ